jgi:hypothetical protein
VEVNLYSHDQTKNGMRRARETHGGEKAMHTRFWWGDLRERHHLENLSVDGRIILKCVFKKWKGARTEFIRIRIGTSGWLL